MGSQGRTDRVIDADADDTQLLVALGAAGLVVLSTIYVNTMPKTQLCANMCDWQVYGLAKWSLPWVKRKWIEGGRTWPLSETEEYQFIRVMTAVAFQESVFDKSAPYCKYRPCAKAGTTTATGLTQIVRPTWRDIQGRILRIPKAEHVPHSYAKKPIWALRLGMAYLLDMYVYKGTRDWKRAARRYHDGYGESHSHGPTYAHNVMDKWMKQFDWGMLDITSMTRIGYFLQQMHDSRREFA